MQHFKKRPPILFYGRHQFPDWLSNSLNSASVWRAIQDRYSKNRRQIWMAAAFALLPIVLRLTAFEFA